MVQFCERFQRDEVGTLNFLQHCAALAIVDSESRKRTRTNPLVTFRHPYAPGTNP